MEPRIHTVGQQQAIVCTAALIPEETFDSSESVMFSWVTPDGVDINDDRVTILPTTINGNNYTSILQFDYLMESDVGNYTCDIISNISTIPQSVELKDLISTL